ncbi:MAG: DHH family phosphoesterase [Caldilineaceae bacterium]|nr:DHH family phosphoesterase [Caldilineaceae bacterium]
MTATESNTRLHSLLRALDGADNVLILTHNNPDPDAIASALAMKYLVQHVTSATATIGYRGIIGRAENRALVRYLEFPLQRVTLAEIDKAKTLIMVDTQPGTGNNPLTNERRIAAILDHHPKLEAPANAEHVDIRPEIGAASTMLTQYVQAAELPLEQQLATALFYGISTDTMSLQRGTTNEDQKAFCALLPKVDFEAIARIETAALPQDYFSQLHKALRSARIYDSAVIASIGEMRYPDITADMADLLLRYRECRWAICLGVYKDTVYFSIRTQNKRGAGLLARKVVGSDGAAGGHGAMAGGQIPLNGRKPRSVINRLRQQFRLELGGSGKETGAKLV